MDFSCSKWRPQVEVLGLLINTNSKTKAEILRVKSEAWLCIGPHHASQGSQQKEINLGGVGGGGGGGEKLSIRARLQKRGEVLVTEDSLRLL